MAQRSEQERLTTRIRQLTGWKTAGPCKIVTDTSDYMRLSRGQVIRLEGRDYLVRGNQYESRFGIADQPKFWVFDALDLNTGEKKIIKAVFNEDFHVHIGLFRIHCYRSPEKEARVLDLTRGDDRFMQGYTASDEKGNLVRVLDYIRGGNLMELIHRINKCHEDYFQQDLPHILRQLRGPLEAVALLHRHGTCHGDIRNDHILVDSKTGLFRWIDFDLNQHVSDFDTWSLGNIINYAVGMGINAFQTVLKSQAFSAEVKSSLGPEDASAFYQYRVMNLRKLYPYIPARLSDILMPFTNQPPNFYTSVEQLIDDYHEMLDTEFSGK